MDSPSQDSSKEDSKLIKKAKQDQKTYDTLYEKYAKRIYLYILRRVGLQKETAEDLTQETFVHGLKGLSRFHSKGFSYLTYLIKIAHNLLVNYYRKAGKITTSSLQAHKELGEKADIEEKIDEKFAYNELKQLMKELPKPEQDALFLYYEKEYAIKEISKVMQKSENAVKLLLSRARKKLLELSLQRSSKNPQ